MMFLFCKRLDFLRNGVTKANIHLLYTCIVNKSSTSNWNNQDKTQNMLRPKRIVSYEDMQKVINEPRKVVIDVREPEEVQSTGQIPSSINIPLSSVHETLQSMSQEDFRRQFKRDKPTSDDELIFYCKSGRRASEAVEKALQLGYKNSKSYLGSWTEWSSKRK